MAIITTYPLDASPVAGDYLVGSKITNTGGQLNPTKNFTIGSVVEAGLGYTVYTALVTQTAAGAPVATILKNNTGGAITWTRTGVGTYRCTASSPIFTATNKVQVFINQGKPGAIGTFIQWERINTTTIGIDTYNIAGAAADSKLDNAPIEIRIYN